MEVRQRPRCTVRPDPEQLVVDVLRLDGREPNTLHRRLIEQSPHEAGERHGRPRMGTAEPPLRPAPVVCPDVDPRKDDLAMTRAKRAPDVLQHGLRGEAPFRTARRRDDAVRAEERAAILDLDERPRPFDGGAAIGDAFDLDAGQGRQRSIERASWPLSGPTSAASSRNNPSFALLSTRRAAGSAAANASRPTWTEQPVTTISASGFARRARRTAWRDFWSAVEVTVQVLTRTRSAEVSPSTTAMPRSRSSRAADSISDWLTLQPRLAIAAVRTALTTAPASCS